MVGHCPAGLEVSRARRIRGSTGGCAQRLIAMAREPWADLSAGNSRQSYDPGGRTLDGLVGHRRRLSASSRTIFWPGTPR
jgi:hypothetical protein